MTYKISEITKLLWSGTWGAHDQIAAHESDSVSNKYHFILSLLIHILVILLVITGSDVVHPGLVVKVPADGFLYALFKLEGGFPAKLALELGGVNGISQIVPGAVCDVGDKVHVCTFRAAQEPVYGVNEHLDDVDVLPFVEAANVVGFGNLTLMENEVDCPGVVLNVEPVTDVLAFAVYRQGFPVTDVVDEKGYQLLRELVGTVVVGAVCDDGGHPEGIVKRPHKVVR